MAAFTSRSTIRPAGPEPSIFERSRSFSLASRRTIGEALNCPLPPAPLPEGASACAPPSSDSPSSVSVAVAPAPPPPPLARGPLRRRPAVLGLPFLRLRGGRLGTAPCFAVPARFCFRPAGGSRLAAQFGDLFAPPAPKR